MSVNQKEEKKGQSDTKKTKKHLCNGFHFRSKK